MNRTLFFILILTALALTACGQSSTPTPIPTVVLSSKPAAASNAVTASGEVVPVQKASLSFPMTGTVTTVPVKEGQSVSAGQTLVTLDTTILEANVKEAQAGVNAAQTQVKYLKRIGTDQEHIDSARADVESAQASLDSANATLAHATLTAPFDGTIASVEISPAETVVPGQVVIMMGDLSQFQIETTDLSERDVTDVQIGQSANASVRALNQTLSGKVVDVARVSTTVGGDVVYKVTIQLDKQPQGLRWGMTIDVQIDTGN
jgi:RND family efflux transporter MFP subunit